MKWLLLFLTFTLHASWKEEFKSYIKSGDVPQWMIEQIRSDLSRAQGLVISPTEECLLVTIKQGKLSYDTHLVSLGKIDWVVGPIRKGLKNLSKVATLPDTQFLIWTGDSLKEGVCDAPVFAFATDRGNCRGVILMPDYEAMRGNDHLIEIVDRGAKEYPWRRKLPMAIWRGSMYGGAFTIDRFRECPRTKAVLLSEEHPERIKAHFFFDPNQNSSVYKQEVFDAYPQYFAGHLPIETHLRFKYQLLIDGVACCYARTYWQLFSNCAIFKQTSPSIQWYYRALRPYEHYIPVEKDLSDLMGKLDWAECNDRVVKRIADQGRFFANENLTYARIMQYMYLLLIEYSGRFAR